MSSLNKMDVLFVGAGPASLAGAIKLKQLLNEKGRQESVVVIEKAEKLGQHSLSGAVFEAHILDELLPKWRESQDKFVVKMLANKVERDELVFLPNGTSAIKVPEGIIPAPMHHKGDYAISLSELVNWLGDIARGLGVEIYHSFAAKELIIEGDVVKGVRLGDKGLNKEGHKQSNYIPGEVLEAKVTVLGEGSLGLLAEDLVKRFNLNKDRNPQVHSVGAKEIMRLPEKNNLGANRIIHTLGFPNPHVFGGGTVYSVGENLVAVAVILGLDWRYCDLNPQQELQVFKNHPFIKKLLEGGEVIAYGAKTLPEGGYYSIPELVSNGAMIIGDNAGLTNVQKLKGLHYAVKSGIAAGQAIFSAIEHNTFSKRALAKYSDLLEQSFVMQDLKKARNYRQVFAKAGRCGVYCGAPLTFVQQMFGKLSLKPDHEAMTRARLNRKNVGGLDRLTDVSFSGTHHREEEPSHITFKDPLQCEACETKTGCHPCEYFCPGEVYKAEDHKIILSPSNCVHCQTCRVKCPMQNIKWQVPEGGDGPKYKLM